MRCRTHTGPVCIWPSKWRPRQSKHSFRSWLFQEANVAQLINSSGCNKNGPQMASKHCFWDGRLRCVMIQTLIARGFYVPTSPVETPHDETFHMLKFTSRHHTRPFFRLWTSASVGSNAFLRRKVSLKGRASRRGNVFEGLRSTKAEVFEESTSPFYSESYCCFVVKKT